MGSGQRISGEVVRLVSVIGSSKATPGQIGEAESLGELLAEAGLTVVCGGGSGVMEAVCRGCRRRGGLTVGVLPTAETCFANDHVQIRIPTGLGSARNRIVALAGEVVVAVGGRYGTLSEIAFALDAGRAVCSIGGWSDLPGVTSVGTPRDALDFVLSHIGQSRRDAPADH